MKIKLYKYFRGGYLFNSSNIAFNGKAVKQGVNQAQLFIIKLTADKNKIELDYNFRD